MSIDTISHFEDAPAAVKNPFRGKNLQSVLFKFSAPAVTGIIVSAMYNVADRAFIGHSAGPDGIAAITVTFPLSIFIMACGIMAGVGGSVLFSISLGRKHYDKAERILGNTLMMVFILTAGVAAAWRIFLTPLLKLLGASGDVLPLARDYMKILLLGGPVQGIAMGMNNMLRATGRPKLAMLTMIIGAVINCILGPLFIFGLKWGMEGAALGVVLSQLVSMTWTLVHFVLPSERYRLHFKYLKPDFKIVRQIAAIGSSQFIMNTAIAALNIVLNLTLVHYGGDLAIFAMGIVTSVNTLTIMPVIGVAQGLQPILGYYYGARYHKRMIQFFRTGVKWATIITCASFILIMVFAREMAHVFSADEDLIQLAARALRTFNMFVPLVGFQVIGGTFFQATAQPVKAVILTLSRQILVLFPLIIILPLFIGLNGVFIAGPSADFAVSAITFFLLTREMKKYQPRKISPEGQRAQARE